jgi:hypothetical protein
MLVSAACITAPPPQLPEETEHRPTILHESVVPSGVILAELPLEFEVPVDLEDPNESFQWDVFIDYEACIDPPNCTSATPPRTPPGVVTVTPTPGTLDGGIAWVSFSAPTDLDPSQCHSIQVFVAHQFEPGSPHQPDSIGGDSVQWIYDPPGAVSCDLIVYDAGAFQDGAFPPADAPSEALPAVPESGTD